MKRTFTIILIILGLIVVIGVGVLIFERFTSQSTQNTSTTTGTGFPSSGSNSTNPSGGTTSPSTGVMTLPTQDGSSVATRNFINNGTTVEDPENPGTYYLAGSVGYCNPDGSCPSGAPSNDFHVVYFSQSKSFIISLLHEPLGPTRIEAQQFLMQALGITQQQMCNLNYDVLTTADVNDTYAGQNLGFSFCPGAVELPQ